MSIESNEGGVVPRRLWPVARGLAEGFENEEIAERCSLAKHTVADYVHQLKAWLDEPNRVKLAMRCKAPGDDPHGGYAQNSLDVGVDLNGRVLFVHEGS